MQVLITGVRAPVALHLVRLLGSAGHKVHLADHVSAPLAAASRHATRYHRIPAFAHSPGPACNALAVIIARHNIGLVIPTCEEALHLGAIWAERDMGVPLFAPKFALLRRVHNKFGFIELCRDLGLYVPETRLLTNGDALAACTAEAADLVFKPVWSRFGSAVLIRPTAATLKRIAPTEQRPWVAQEFVSGTELCVYAIARQGRLLALAAYRGLVRAGPGAAVCFAPSDPEVVRPFVERFVSATGWTGQISFDLVQTEKELFPLECNPRATSGLHLFRDSEAFSRAVLSGGSEVRPDVTAPQAVRLALWIYGLPMLLRQRDRQVFLDAVGQAGDVMDWDGDRVGAIAQLRSLAEFARIAMRHRVSLERASTWGIEWNGEDEWPSQLEPSQERDADPG
ncbi:ATP-grasp domain-containing protein [Palleronia caenipelagi]|uniref:ATP-grasp domain-containing protein n=1 Tax=Palleronia caenipelagi TaxID=2489174 RepID=A0A547PNS1_9RHOB|nr:ATP-grasp domain-containing protein [Palleronia caenipelagi]TRD15796.1 ATP-grasp domain-containing protein [Palleronia caenipelagi]